MLRSAGICEATTKARPCHAGQTGSRVWRVTRTGGRGDVVVTRPAASIDDEVKAKTTAMSCGIRRLSRGEGDDRHLSRVGDSTASSTARSQLTSRRAKWRAARPASSPISRTAMLLQSDLFPPPSAKATNSTPLDPVIFGVGRSTMFNLSRVYPREHWSGSRLNQLRPNSPTTHPEASRKYDPNRSLRR